MRIQKMRIRLDTAREVAEAFRLVGLRHKTFAVAAKEQPPYTEVEERVGRYIPPEERAYLVGETLGTFWEEDRTETSRRLCVSLDDESRGPESGWQFFWADLGPKGSRFFGEEILEALLRASLGGSFDREIAECGAVSKLKQLVELAARAWENHRYEILFVDRDTITCPICGKLVPAEAPSPYDGIAWAELAEIHEPECEWVVRRVQGFATNVSPTSD